MTDTLTKDEVTLELAGEWETAAKSIERFDPDDPKVKVLRTCADDLRRIVESHARDSYHLSPIRDRTGWSLPWLRARAEELEADGLAWKDGAGRWKIAREAALRIPVKDEGVDLEGVEDLSEMARRLGRQPEQGR